LFIVSYLTRYTQKMHDHSLRNHVLFSTSFGTLTNQ